MTITRHAADSTRRGKTQDVDLFISGAVLKVRVGVMYWAAKVPLVLTEKLLQDASPEIFLKRKRESDSDSRILA